VNKENIENQEKIYLKDLEFELTDLKIVRAALKLFLAEIDFAELKNLRVHRVIKSNEKKTEQDKVTKQLKESESNWEIDIDSYLVVDKNNETFSLNQLSSGEKSVVILVADIARRLIEAKGSENENILETDGMILIDEIQMHLHPNWQRKILPALTKTFPNIQFIVTTHSPQVVSSLNKESIFILENFKLIQNTPFTKGRDANSILMEVFGVSRWTDEVKKQINDLYRLIDDEKREEALEALEKLKEDFGERDIEVVRANTYIDLIDDEEYNKE